MRKNYYIILGIPSDSTQTSIKEAYRRRAKELHPDHYGENQTPFQDLQEAYSTLSDPENRKAYDKTLQDTARNSQRFGRNTDYDSFEEEVEPLVPEEGRPSFTGRSRHRPYSDPWSVFDSFFDQIFENFGNLTGYRHPGISRLEDFTIEIILSPAQARNGGDLRLQLPIRRRCPSCNGYSSFSFYDCRRCNGTGFLSGVETVSLNYPAGITENRSYRFSLSLDEAEDVSFTVLFKIR